MVVRVQYKESDVIGTTVVTLATALYDYEHRAFVIMWVTDKATTTSTPDYYTAAAVLTSSTQLTVYPNGSSGAPRTRIGICVVDCTEEEFYSEQFQGFFATSSATSSVLLSRTYADATRRMVVANVAANSSALTYNEHEATFEFSDSTHILATRQGTLTTAGAYFKGWVVEWRAETGVNVVTGTKDLNSNIASGVTATHGSPTTDLTRQCLFSSTRHAVSGLEQSTVGAYLNTRTTALFERRNDTGSYDSDAVYYVVAFPTGGCYGQSVRYTTIIAGASVATIGFGTAFTIANTILTHGSTTCAGTGTAFPRNRWTFTLDSTTTARATRYYTGQVAEAHATVMDLSNWRFHRQPHMAGRGF